MITPEKAKEMLEGATPGPWDWDAGDDRIPLVSVDGYGTVAQGIGLYDDHVWVDCGDKDGALVAAAPELAQQIAGMHWEYAVQVCDENDEWLNYAGWENKANGDYDMILLDPASPEGWVRTLGVAQDAFEDCAADETRIVRRMVTELEEIEL